MLATYIYSKNNHIMTSVTAFTEFIVRFHGLILEQNHADLPL